MAELHRKAGDDVPAFDVSVSPVVVRSACLGPCPSLGGWGALGAAGLGHPPALRVSRRARAPGSGPLW